MLISLACQLASMAWGNPGQPSPELVRGWMFHCAKPEYHQRVLEAAKRYKINHLEISGSNPTFSEEMAGPQADLVQKTAAHAKTLGIDSYVWIRELNTRDPQLTTDPSTAEGKAFWDKRKDALRTALKAAPSLAGIVMSYGSTPTEIWHVADSSPFWQQMAMPERIRFVTKQFQEVVAGEFGKRMYIRDFNHSPQQLKWLIEGLKDFPNIRMHSKWEPQDWQLFYPDSFSIGAYGSVPQVIEADLGAEYWGRSMVPVSLVEHIKKRWSYDKAHGCIGVVARIDRDDETCLGTPSEINLYALMRFMDDANLNPGKVYSEWLDKRYGLKPGSKAAKVLQKIYERGTEQAKLQYFTLGFWTPKNQTMIPDSVRSIESCIIGKSTALWDPSAKPLQGELMKPTEATCKRILADRAKAVALAMTNLEDFKAVKPGLKSDDANDWQSRLDLAFQFAEVWESMADAVWSLRVAETASSKQTDQLITKADRFEKLARELVGAGPGKGLRDGMAASAKKLADDIRNRARSIGAN